MLAGCAASSALTQNERGLILPLAGVNSVATHPAARRKGYAKGMIPHVHETF